MSREIKFRAWDLLNNKMWQHGQDGESIDCWTFQTYFNPSDHNLTAIIYGEDFLVTDDPYTMYDHEEKVLPIMQFTGLKDKNGVEIYEGDIVKVYYKKGEIELGKIEWMSARHRFVFNSGDGSWGFDNKTPFEIIGNIHETPELLEVQS